MVPVPPAAMGLGKGSTACAALVRSADLPAHKWARHGAPTDSLNLPCPCLCSNYAACILKHPGPVQQHLQRCALDSAGRVQRGALDACRYCDR